MSRDSAPQVAVVYCSEKAFYWVHDTINALYTRNVYVKGVHCSGLLRYGPACAPKVVLCAGNATKRRRTEAEVTAERAARDEKRSAKEAALAAQREAAAGGGAFRLKAVQPWADKESKAEELTEEQKEYLAKVEAEKKAKEAEKEKTEAVQHPSRSGTRNSSRQLSQACVNVRTAPSACFLVAKWSGLSSALCGCAASVILAEEQKIPLLTIG